MSCLRCLLPALTLVLSSACQDASSPQPPPRVPKPKVEREAADPMPSRPAAKPRAQEV